LGGERREFIRGLTAKTDGEGGVEGIAMAVLPADVHDNAFTDDAGVGAVVLICHQIALAGQMSILPDQRTS
jgi:hypothetical protein